MDLSDRMGGAVHLVFPDEKKAEDHKLVRRIFCLAATGFIAGTALCLPIGVRKFQEMKKRNFNWNGVP